LTYSHLSLFAFYIKLIRVRFFAIKRGKKVRRQVQYVLIDGRKKGGKSLKKATARKRNEKNILLICETGQL